MTTLVIATRNRHKVQEIHALLSDLFSYQTLDDFPGAPTVLEDADTFAGNATKKALELARWLSETRHPRLANSSQPAPVIYALADDSGLEVDALNGAPGVHSARFAALEGGASGNSGDQANNAKLLHLLASIPPDQRTARFQCVIALSPVLLQQPTPASPVCYADEAELSTQLFYGTCEGRIIDAPRGTGGFGYDPLFVPDGFHQTFAELGEEIKNQLSHRSKALRQLEHWFKRRSLT